MYFYASGWVGTGTATDPFRPAVAALLTSAEVVDLRPDQTVTTGACIVATPARCDETGDLFTRWSSLANAFAARTAGLPGARYLGDENTALGAVARAVLGRMAGFGTALDSTSTSVRLALREILVTRALNDGTTVRQLRPEADGVARIRVGGFTWDA